MKRYLQIVLPIFVLGFTIWKLWPETKPLPEHEHKNLFEIGDFEILIGKSIKPVPLKNGKPYLYTESNGGDCKIRGLMENGEVGINTFNFRSSYQICAEEKDSRSLFQGNTLMRKIPGVQTEEIPIDSSNCMIHIYKGNGTIFVSAVSKSVYYTAQVEPEIDFSNEKFAKLILEKLNRVKNNLNQIENIGQ